MTLRIPDTQLDRGSVYYAQPGGDDQMVLRSRAPLRNAVLTTSRLVGYLATPFAPEDELGPPVTAGAFRIPVAALRTGIESGREILAGAGFFDALAHPELTFLVTETRDVRRLPDGHATSLRFELTLAGTLRARGAQAPLAVPVRLTFMPATDHTMMGRMDGDLLLVEGSVSISLEALGYEPPRRFRESVADELQVELRMLLSTVSPDRSLDPRDDPALHEKRLRIVTLLADLDDAASGYALAHDYVKEIWDRPDELTRLARDLAVAEVRPQDWALTLRVARRANELTLGESTASLEALALVHHEMGHAVDAVEWQRRAADQVDPSRERWAQRVRETLARYEAVVRARPPMPSKGDAPAAPPLEGEKP